MQLRGAVIREIDKRNRDKGDSHVSRSRPEAFETGERNAIFEIYYITRSPLHYRTIENKSRVRKRYAATKLVVSHSRDLAARSRWRYRSWLVINERRAREKSKAIKPHCALLTNYPPWIVIASLCQSPSELHPFTRSICIPTFVLRKPRCLFLTRVPTESCWPFYRTTAVSIKISSYR